VEQYTHNNPNEAPNPKRQYTRKQSMNLELKLKYNIGVSKDKLYYKQEGA
jgi:hypothetical protein